MHSNYTIPPITITFLPFSIPFVLLAPSLLHFFLYSSRLCDLIRGSAMSGEDGYGGGDEAVGEIEGEDGRFGGRSRVRHFSSLYVEIVMS